MSRYEKIYKNQDAPANKHSNTCAIQPYLGYSMVDPFYYTTLCDCGFDPRPKDYWKENGTPLAGHYNQLVPTLRKVGRTTDWSGFGVTYKPCRICHAQTNNNFDLCPKDCMQIYSAWKTLGIIPEHVRIK